MHPISCRLSPSAHVTAMQQISSHGLFDLDIQAEGDTWIDDHHTNEDLGELSMQTLAVKVHAMQLLLFCGTPLTGIVHSTKGE